MSFPFKFRNIKKQLSMVILEVSLYLEVAAVYALDKRLSFWQNISIIV